MPRGPARNPVVWSSRPTRVHGFSRRLQCALFARVSLIRYLMLQFKYLPRILASCALWSLAAVATADDAFWESPDAYLGMKRPGATPEIFAPGLLAEPDTFVMGRVAFSRDGKEFY